MTFSFVERQTKEQFAARNNTGACYNDNLASMKTILKNGGQLENEIVEDKSGKIIQRYWISLNE